MRIQPSEAVYMKLNTKTPGLHTRVLPVEMDLTYKKRFSETNIPEAYEALILDALKGDHSNFVRDDELDVAWKVSINAVHRCQGVIHNFNITDLHSVVALDRRKEWSPTSSRPLPLRLSWSQRAFCFHCQVWLQEDRCWIVSIIFHIFHHTTLTFPFSVWPVTSVANL